MRKLIGLMFLPFAGCAALSPAQIGWSFQVGRAPAVLTSAIVTPQATAYGVNPMAAYPALPVGTTQSAVAFPAPQAIQSLPSEAPVARLRTAPAPSQECCDEVLRALRTMNDRLDRMSAPKRMEP